MRSQSAVPRQARSLTRTAAKVYFAPFIPLAILMGVLVILGGLIFGLQIVAAILQHFRI